MSSPLAYRPTEARPRPQGGTTLNYFGTGLILPFEIIYLHGIRGFSTATAGLVLATVMGTAAVVTLPSGALLDRFSAKRLLIAGTVLNALGYGGLAFVDRPWQGFVCSAVGGAGFGLVGSRRPGPDDDPDPGGAARCIDRAPTSRGELRSRPRSNRCGRVVAATDHSLRAFQSLYLFDAVTFVALRAGCARLDPGSRARGSAVGE